MTEKYFRGAKGKETIDDPMREIINALDRLNKSLDNSNKTNDSMAKVLEQAQRERMSTKVDKDHPSGVIRSSSAFGKNAPKILKDISEGEYRVSEGELSSIRHEMETYEHMMATVGKSLKEFVDNPLKKVAMSFKDLFDTTKNLDHNFKSLEDDSEPQSVINDTGVVASMRRGMLDIHGEVESKGIKDKIGRFLGNTMAHASGVSMAERKAYARDSLYNEQELKRAKSEDPEERTKMLGHEVSQLHEQKRNIRAGKVDLHGLSEEEYLKQYGEKMVKSNNLRVLERFDPDFEKKNQAKMRYDLGLEAKQSFFKREDEKDPEEAGYKKTPYVKKMEKRYSDKEAKKAKRQAELDALRKKEELIQRTREAKRNGEKSGVIEPEELKVGEEIAPDLMVAPNEVVTSEDGGLRLPSRDEILSRRDPKTGRAPINMEEDYPEDYVQADIRPQYTQPQPLQQSFKIDDGDHLSEEDEQKSSLPDIKKALEQINETLKTGDYNIKSMNVDEFKIKSLTIESLVKPESEQGQQPTAQDSGNPLADVAGAAAEVGNTRALGRFGKVGKFLGKGARLLGKAALPISALMAGSDAISGYSNAAENLGIEGREATFGEKMSSALGSVASGLSLGLVDEKNAGKGIANFFGAGEESSKEMTTTESVSGTLSGVTTKDIENHPNYEKYYKEALGSQTDDTAKRDAREEATMNVKADMVKERSIKNLQSSQNISPVSSSEVKPIPDGKQNDLLSAKSENDSLLEAEKMNNATKPSNVIVNAPTSIANVGGGGGGRSQIEIRPNHNAYERFVDRVFTA